MLDFVVQGCKDSGLRVGIFCAPRMHRCLGGGSRSARAALRRNYCTGSPNPTPRLIYGGFGFELAFSVFTAQAYSQPCNCLNGSS